ncbi:TlpA family protein disulfide reductase [Flavobacterium pectinovorum]|uniref:AhpC/TSA family protein n=1 Tax=Flavobacterium pectinovorum TaxID=29533 RepID=A0AB36NUZ7_9FLAO|nr:redoxin domain-containing protein [Flavobacterium pectinovorum]OXA99374.1 AhpC/TSA family protein [Flavobacterium pectinovorum]SHL68033.1 AhpC/TSA family protein [Flavobacterium pectinovorum]
MRRKILVGLWISLLFCAISFLFWQNEIKYTLPTPIPQNFHQIAIGNKVDLKCCITDNRPVFIHFFNPDCPCSRFNIPHVSGLIKKYGDRINFKIVVLNKKKNFTIEEIQKKFDAKIPVYFDESIAKNCGVFSTPQAVIVDPSHNLYYRGNYNKTRYCTNADSNYAQMALESLLKQTKTPSFDALALRAYGCSLPKCSK